MTEILLLAFACLSLAGAYTAGYHAGREDQDGMDGEDLYQRYKLRLGEHEEDFEA